MINDKMKAEDIVQEVFIKLYKNFSQIHNQESILYWLFSTTKNEVYCYFRNKTNKNVFIHSSDPDEIEMRSESSLIEEYEISEINSMINKELDGMNPEQKEVFVLREYSGLSYKEISLLMNIEENLVRSRLYKTRQKLINKLSQILQ